MEGRADTADPATAGWGSPCLRTTVTKATSQRLLMLQPQLQLLHVTSELANMSIVQMRTTLGNSPKGLKRKKNSNTLPSGVKRLCSPHVDGGMETAVCWISFFLRDTFIHLSFRYPISNT